MKKVSYLTDPEDLSFIYSLLRNSVDIMDETTTPTAITCSGNSRKLYHREQGDGNDGNDGNDGYDEDNNSSEVVEDNTAGDTKLGLKGVLTSLLLLEEQQKRKRQVMDEVSEDDKLFIEYNHKMETKSMSGHNLNFQASYSEVEESDRIKRKKSRAMAGVVAVSSSAAAASSDDLSKVHTDKGHKSGGGGGSGHQRRLWVKDRSKAWWDECNRPEYPEEEFKKAFRMRRSTFDMICEELNSVIAKEDTTLRNAIPVRQRVAVCLWRLATGDPLRVVSKRFGLGISTCHKLVLEVCSAIRTVLMPKFLQWPDEITLRKIKEECESISGIPNVVGSMYTTHIPIIAPKISVAAYFNKRHTERNQKTSYSITVQGVVDPRGVFTDVCIGWPGSMPDDQVLERSALYQRANGGLLKGAWLVGGSGYPLMDWVLVPYTRQNLTWTQHAFNEKVGELQRVAKGGFARLKARWRCLQKRTEVKLQDLPIVLGACCVLHNICELEKEEVDPALGFELVDDDMVPEVALRSVSSTKARDEIAHNLLHHGLAGTAFL